VTLTLESLCRDARVLVRREGAPDPEGRCVLYWMQRAQRAHDNPALDVAIGAANALSQPLVVFFRLVPFGPHATWRAYHFMLQGLEEMGEALAARGALFVLRRHPDSPLPAFAEEVRASLVVGDENPLREPARWRQEAAAELRVPLWTVDADVVVPTRLLAKEQYAARTMRPRLHRLLAEHLRRPREPSVQHPWRRRPRPWSLVAASELLDDLTIDRAVAPVSHWRGGSSEGRRRLRAFVRQGLAGYAELRNRPEHEGTSRLSPYLHFGQVGPREVALAVQAADAPPADKQAFLEQLIVRRELAVNFVHFNPAYDRLEGCEPWARRTLATHAGDRRLLLSPAQLEAAETPDPLWNAAQRQMTQSGWMHNYLRMYWAKRLLEWCPTPEEAFALAVSLNDRYELDGRDPNGYAGIAWAIGGKHDRAFGPERPIFGKVRFMSPTAIRKKFDAASYIELVAEQAYGR
jgi:deoxyribodipyrimidine photo-lyase